MGFKSGFSLFLFLCLLGAASAFALDFDKDKSDDIIYVTINKDKTLSWRYRSSKSKRLVAIGRFGIPGQNLIPGVWNGSPTLATVSSPDALSTKWSFRTSTAFELGSDNALTISGADLNGDKNLDPIAIDINGSALEWKTFAGAFGDATSLRVSTFGTVGDLPFIWQTPKGKSEYAVLNSTHITVPTVFTLSANDEVRYFSLSSSPVFNQRPFTVISGKRTYLIFPLVQKTKTLFSIYRNDGKYLRQVSVSATGETLVGKFNPGSADQHIAVHSGKTIFSLNVGTGKVTRLTGFTGIPVDDLNINSASVFPNTPPKGLTASCYPYSSNDGYKRGFIWKPNSDTQRFAVAVMPHEFANKISAIELYSSIGEFIKSIPSKGCGNADDEGIRCAFQDKQFTGQEYQAKYGSLFLRAAKNDGTCAVFKLATPGKRID